MTKIQEKLGYTFPTYSFAVERGKIREFAKAIGDENPIYFDVEEAKKAGYEDLPVPPTFATVIDMWAGPSFEDLIEALELNGLRVLHGEQSFEYLHPIQAGDVITANQKVVKVYQKQGMSFFILESTYTNQAGQTVLTAGSTLIELMDKE